MSGDAAEFPQLETLKKAENMFKMETNYCADFKSALRFWDNTPLVDAYF